MSATEMDIEIEVRIDHESLVLMVVNELNAEGATAMADIVRDQPLMAVEVQDDLGIRLYFEKVVVNI